MMLNENERNTLREQIAELLDEYDYEYNTNALNKIVNEWNEQKSWLIDAFKKHPNYVEGKYLIAFDVDYERTIDKNAIRKFRDWLLYNVVRTTEYANKLPEDAIQLGCFCKREVYDIFDYLNHIKTREIDEAFAKEINNALPKMKATPGMKTSRIINKICTYLHYNEHPDYNREFAKYADALSPMIIKRHTILSINPLDYLTMSFGNSWASCHTIDKRNRRGMRDSYEGCYSSGTVSYMLDDCSMVLYTVDETYDGTDYYSQAKINRQMFHFGEDKLVQGRLYPQSMDGDNDAYKPYRQIVQEILAKVFDFPNLWTVSHNIEHVESDGTHYRDYNHFSSCTLSRPTGTHNDTYITIGADPICVECGCRHTCEDNINCCNSGRIRCADCGAWIDEDDAHYVDGDYYCEDCVNYCDYCDEWTRDSLEYVSGYGDVCEHCLEYRFTQCKNCGNYEHNDDIRYCEEDDRYYCDECYRERMRELEAEEEDADAEEDENTTETQTSEWRVVDRAPRVGDYVRLKEKVFSFNRIGDILHVDKVGTLGFYVYGYNHPCDTRHPNEDWCYWNTQAEVIEKVED